MMYEVESKFHADDLAQTEQRLVELGAMRGKLVQQVDQYYLHPARDFISTDEALRIRTVGDRSVVTYKGPMLDAVTKTRKEIEIPFGATPEDLRKAFDFYFEEFAVRKEVE